MTRTLTFIITLLFSLTASAEFVSGGPPEYLLKATKRDATGKSTYVLQYVDSESLEGNEILEFETDMPITHFVVTPNQRQGDRLLYALTLDGTLIHVNVHGKIMRVLSNIKDLIAGPNGSIFVRPIGNDKMVQHLSTMAQLTDIVFPHEVKAIAWNGTTTGFDVILYPNQNVTGTYELVQSDLKGKLTPLGKLQFSGHTLGLNPFKIEFRHDVAYVNFLGSHYLMTMTSSGSETYFIPSAVNYSGLQLLDVAVNRRGALSAWMRSENDLVELELGKNGQLSFVSLYYDAFDDKHVTEAVGVDARFRYSHADAISIPTFAARLKKIKPLIPAASVPAAPAPATPKSAPEVSRDERVREAVRDEIVRLNNILRYIGFGGATLSSADWIRALEQAGGDSFWKNSLFKDIDMDELRIHPVAMDELVDVLTAKLPASVICSIPLVKP